MGGRKPRTAVREFTFDKRTPVRESNRATGDSLALILPEPPSLNQWKTPIGFGRSIKSREFHAYVRAVNQYAPLQLRGAAPMEGPLAVTVRWYRKRRIGDLDGRMKALFDSLNGIAWMDDAQIEEIHASRHEAPDDPRVELEVVRLWAPSP